MNVVDIKFTMIHFVRVGLFGFCFPLGSLELGALGRGVFQVFHGFPTSRPCLGQLPLSGCRLTDVWEARLTRPVDLSLSAWHEQNMFLSSWCSAWWTSLRFYFALGSTCVLVQNIWCFVDPSWNFLRVCFEHRKAVRQPIDWCFHASRGLPDLALQTVLLLVSSIWIAWLFTTLWGHWWFLHVSATFWLFSFIISCFSSCGWWCKKPAYLPHSVLQFVLTPWQLYDAGVCLATFWGAWNSRLLKHLWHQSKHVDRMFLTTQQAMPPSRGFDVLWTGQDHTF